MMPQPAASVDLIALALRDLAEDRGALIASALEEMPPAEIAALLEGMPPEPRLATWALVCEEQRGEVLAYVHDEARAGLIGEMQTEELVEAAERMDDEDLAEVLEELPADFTETVLTALDEDHRRRVEAVLSYPEGTAERFMSTDVVSVRADVTLAVVAWLWFQSAGLAAIIAVAMILNLLIAALSGIVVPMVLHRFGIDPALSGAVILTTVTDVVGFLSFLGLATLFLI